MKRNLWKIIILVLLVAVNLILFFKENSSYALSYDPDRFMVTDQSSFSSITLSGENGEILLQNNEEEGWKLNQKYLADQQLTILVQRILQSVKVRRPVAEKATEPVVDVTIQTSDSKRSFSVWGNATKTKTFFSDNSGTYEVEIPGYRDYLGAIFELKPNQWRDRLIFNGNWRTIQQLNLDRGDSPSLSITFKYEFYEVEGIAAIDSSKVVSYLNLFERFQVNEMVDNTQIPQLDSLIASEPLAQLTIESIDYSTLKKIIIYPALADQPYHVVKTESGLVAVVDQARIDKILAKPSEFLYKR